MVIVEGTWQDEVGTALATWYMNKSGLSFNTAFVAFGFVGDDGDVRSVAILTDYHPYGNIELHFIGRGLPRQVLRFIGNYVFHKLNCSRLTVKLERRNVTLDTYLRRVGFVHECTLKQYHGPHKSRDALVYRLLKQDAFRWID